MKNEEYEVLLAENKRLNKDNENLLNEIKKSREEIIANIEAMGQIKKDMRRYQVQINSLKTENEEFKNKFARIENNPIGKFLLKIYRLLREIKRRRF